VSDTWQSQTIKSLQEGERSAMVWRTSHLPFSSIEWDASSAVVNLLVMERSPLCLHWLVVLPIKPMTKAGLAIVDAIRVCGWSWILWHFLFNSRGLWHFCCCNKNKSHICGCNQHALQSLMGTGCSIQEQESTGSIAGSVTMLLLISIERMVHIVDALLLSWQWQWQHTQDFCHH